MAITIGMISCPDAWDLSVALYFDGSSDNIVVPLESPLFNLKTILSGAVPALVTPLAGNLNGIGWTAVFDFTNFVMTIAFAAAPAIGAATFKFNFWFAGS